MPRPRGFGSNLAAFLHGVPAVGPGTRQGKKDRIGDNKLGIDLRSERPKPAAFRKAVPRVLDDPIYARKGTELRAELQAYDPIGLIEESLLQENISHPELTRAPR